MAAIEEIVEVALHETASTKMEILIKTICETHQITPLLLSCRRQSKDLVAARRDYAVLGRLFGLSYSALGRAIDRDHSSIMHLVKK